MEAMPSSKWEPKDDTVTLQHHPSFNHRQLAAGQWRDGGDALLNPKPEDDTVIVAV